MLKQVLARKLNPTLSPKAGDKGGAPIGGFRFWQARYYDFNVWAAKKRIEKLRYMHRNPVKRGLVEKPEDWAWSSFVHYATGVEGVVWRSSRNGPVDGGNGWECRCESRFGRRRPPCRQNRATRAGHPMFKMQDRKAGPPALVLLCHPERRSPQRPESRDLRFIRL
jgi:hypothetical protein